MVPPTALMRLRGVGERDETDLRFNILFKKMINGYLGHKRG